MTKCRNCSGVMKSLCCMWSHHSLLTCRHWPSYKQMRICRWKCSGEERKLLRAVDVMMRYIAEKKRSYWRLGMNWEQIWIYGQIRWGKVRKFQGLRVISSLEDDKVGHCRKHSSAPGVQSAPYTSLKWQLWDKGIRIWKLMHLGMKLINASSNISWWLKILQQVFHFNACEHWQIPCQRN